MQSSFKLMTAGKMLSGQLKPSLSSQCSSVSIYLADSNIAVTKELYV